MTRPRNRAAIAVGAVLLLTGCGREPVQVAAMPASEPGPAFGNYVAGRFADGIGDPRAADFLLEALHQDRDKQFKELVAGYDKLREAFASDVDATLEQARGRAKSAIDRLEQAQRLSPREARDAAAVAEVGAHTELAAVLTRHAVAAESLLALTQTLDAGLKRTGVARDSSIAAGADELAGQRDALADAANAAIADAGSAANRAQSAEADRVAATLESYKSQLPAKSQSN